MADFKKVDFTFKSTVNASIFVRGLFAVDQKTIKLDKTQYDKNIAGHVLSADGFTVRVIMTGTTPFPTREAMALMLRGTHSGVSDAVPGTDYRQTITLTPPDDKPVAEEAVEKTEESTEA
jgi:hypothetical protein